MELSYLMWNTLVFIYSVVSLVDSQFFPMPGNNAASLDDTPETTELQEGARAVLPCTVQNPGDMDVTWFTSSFDIITSGNVTVTIDPRIDIDTDQPGEWNLVIDNVQEKDAGTYICMLQSFPPQEKHFTLIVNTKPKINKESLKERYLFQKGETLAVICKVSGNPEPSVNWYKFRTDMSTMEEVQELVSSTEKLLFKKLGPNDGGIYRCEATNKEGKDMYEIFLQEVYEPKLSTTQNEFVVRETSDIVLQCEIQSNPSANIGWQRDGKLVKTNDFKYNIETYTEGDSKTVTELTIYNINTSDKGDYQCLARNEIGRNYIKYTVIVNIPTTTGKTTTRKPTTVSSTTKPVPIIEVSTSTSTESPKGLTDDLKTTTTAMNYVESPRTGDSRSHASFSTYSFTLLLTLFSISLLIVS